MLFRSKALKENALALIEAVLAAKPQGAKGEFVRSLTISSTMGPGLTLDLKFTREKK